MTMQATKNRRPRKAHWLPALMIAGALLMPGMEQAHAQSRTIVNTGFDKLMNGASPNPPSNAPLYLDDARCTLGVAGKCLAGWQSTHPAHYEFGHMIEAGSSTAIYGVTPNSGTAFVELNAATRSRLYQNICLKSGESIRLSYFLSSRSGTNGAFASQVQAGIWPLNHAGPIGGAIMAVPSSVRPAEQPGWNEETAVLTLPAGYPSGIYQLGFEAILPGNNSSYSNLLDNVTIPIKPLIDLGGSQMNAVAIEGLRRRRSRCGSMAASTRPSRWCSRPPARPSRTRTTAWANPPACRVPRPRWSTRTAAIPGLCWCRKASTTAACRQPWAAASSACPSKPWRMTPPKTTRPRSSRCRRQASTARLPHWTGTWKIRSAAAPAIPSNRPAISSRKRYPRSSSAARYTTTRTATTRWTSKRTGPRWSRWPRTSTSTSCARTKSCRRRRWRPARAAISSPRPAIRTTPSSCRTPRQSLPRPRSTGVSRARRPAFSAPIPKARTHRTSA